MTGNGGVSIGCGCYLSKQNNIFINFVITHTKTAVQHKTGLWVSHNLELRERKSRSTTSSFHNFISYRMNTSNMRWCKENVL
jgi:hypothetical protein